MFQRYKDRKSYKIKNLFVAELQKFSDIELDKCGNVSLINFYKTLEFGIFVLQENELSQIESLKRISNDADVACPECEEDYFEINKNVLYVAKSRLIKFTDFFYGERNILSKKKLTVQEIRELENELNKDYLKSLNNYKSRKTEKDK